MCPQPGRPVRCQSHGRNRNFGPQAEAAVQYLTLNDVRALGTYQLQYSALCHDEGGLLDDLTVCRLAADRFLLIVNAANIDKDFS
jgi:aminomethyltransferase